jgi:uncharacterized protein (DUF1501 family)
MNRYLHARDHEGASPFRAVAIAQQLPRSLQGAAPALAIGNLTRFGVRDDMTGGMTAASGFEAQYAEAADSLLTPVGRDAFDAVKRMSAIDPSSYAPAGGAEYPRSGFGDAMKQIAQIIKGNLGLEVAFTELGQWDHHANEGGATGQLANRLDDFTRGIAAFARDLGDRMADVVVVTMSEFGRTVRENGNRGTDHGHGNAMLILGGDVWQGRDLAVTTDFRDVFTELVTGHLGATDVSRIFPGHTVGKHLGLLKI